MEEKGNAKDNDSGAIRTTQSSEGKASPVLDSSNAHFSVIALAASLIVGGYGCFIAYSDAKVVGGDAYNYIIGAGRGLAIVGLGIIIAIIGVVFALSHLGKYIAFHIGRK